MKTQAVVLFFLFIVRINSHAQQEGYALSTDFTPIYYKTFGNGKPLLIINGGPGMNSAGFEGLADILSKNNQAIIYDQRGTGKSTLKVLNATTVNMKLMMDDLESLRKHLKIERWAILGHSFGGMLASYYATRYPEHIEKIILSSSGGVDLGLLSDGGTSITSKLSKTEADSVDYWTQKINSGDTSYRARIGRARNLAPAYVYDKKHVPVIAERLTQGNSVINQLLWTDLQTIHYNCADQLKTFLQPVLIIQGKQDILSAEVAEKSHQAFKNSRLVFMDHCAHYGWLDNREVYFREVNSFLASKS